jgi:hypothetical protein
MVVLHLVDFLLSVSGDMAKMGKIVAAAPTLKSGPMEGVFALDFVKATPAGPVGLYSPFFVAKKFVR